MDVDVRCTEPIEHQTVGDLLHGDCFQFQDMVYMRVDPHVDANKNHSVIPNDDARALVICVKDGMLETLPKTTEVRRVNAFHVLLKPDFRD